MEVIRPGTSWRSHYKTLRKLWRWAFHLWHVAKDPMGTLRPLDTWGVNNEVLSTKLFQRLLRVIQGLEAPRGGLKVKEKYKGLVPYLVVGGFQGWRTCEIIKGQLIGPGLAWQHFLWRRGLAQLRADR